MGSKKMANRVKKGNKKRDIRFEVSPLIRSFDVVIAAMGLLLLSPVFLVIGLVIKATSPGPILYKAKRVGKDGQLFKLYKFRSMYLDADQIGPGITTRNDARITPVGRFLRRTKLDELPQLLNILRGEMSLVGPRPEDPRYVALYTPEQRQVLSVQPGLTSPASVYYRQEESLLDGDNWEQVYKEQILPRKLAAELSYLQKRTLWSDLFLILQTITSLITDDKRTDLTLAIRNRHLFVLDFLALLIIPAAALTLRLEKTDWSSDVIHSLIFFTSVALLVKFPIFYRMQFYNRYWRYATISDLVKLLIGIGISTLILTIIFISFHGLLAQYKLAMYRTVPLIDGLLTGFIISGYRVAVRGIYHWRQYHGTIGGRRVLVVGAGEAGTMVVREMRANPQLDMEPVAFVDDDFIKIGSEIQGLPVLGKSKDISKLVKQYHIQRIIVAIPSAPLGRQQEIINRCKQTGVVTDIIPGIYELLAGSKTLSKLPELDINRLLRREPILIDQTEVAIAIEGARVLVTGAGGSIGSELCRQIARFNPAEIILLGHGENSIFEINLDLHLSFPNLVTHPAIVDVRDQNRVFQIIEKYRPHIIFHAAAHKHVPFMEESVYEAISNNVLGTQNVLLAAEQFGVDRFILISTDKAVNPTSIMGISKRMAEFLVIAAARRSNKAYMAVRFGNVLGSRGSVIPVFQRQIAAGGPLTITHPDMRRYFMTIPEAVQLVLQAMALGQGSEVFVLDMGQPVKIVDLATDMIKLSGLEPGRDIKIVFSGIRPGEKLNEELFLDGENYQRTKHSKIFVAMPEDSIDAEILEQIVNEIIQLNHRAQLQNNSKAMLTLLPQICHYIDNYRSIISWAKPTIKLSNQAIPFNLLQAHPPTPSAI
jgi:FlaA1/EpsC-like NDP-sugar epimerase/lipopolysaccharide/colanic/teichoic acid biosynthesis glycosyltransferase